MRARGHVSTVLAVSAATALLAGGLASAAATHPANGTWKVLPSTAPVAGQSSALSALAPASHVQVSVFIGRDLAGLAAMARAVSDPAGSRYEHYLTPAEVQEDFGATAAQRRAVGSWLRGAGLTVRYHDSFVVSATGTAARAQAAVRARLELSRPAGGTEQVVSARAMSAPASVAGAISTIRVAPEAIPVGVHEPVRRREHGRREHGRREHGRRECRRGEDREILLRLLRPEAGQGRAGRLRQAARLGAVRVPAAAAAQRVRRDQVRADR